ncbi:MAG: carboxymuconolactone decarboxylase family protein [Phycisphaerae bacterium]
MPAAKRPNMHDILNRMRQAVGEVPPTVEQLARVDPEMIYEHLRSQAYAMPADSPALDDETRTLIYLAAALASSSHECVRATVAKATGQGISREKLLETVRIVRLAMATRVISDAEPVFEAIDNS